VISRCKFFELRKIELCLFLVVLATGCATFEPPVKSEREGEDEVHTQQKEGDPVKVGSEREIKTSREPIEVEESLKAESDLSEPSTGEENAATDFASEQEVKNSLAQQQAKVIERIQSAHMAQLGLKEQLIKDLERQLGVITSETDESMESVEELVALLNATNDLLTELEIEVEKHTQLDDSEGAC